MITFDQIVPFIALVGGLINATAIFCQWIKIVRTKSAIDLSFWWVSLASLAVVCSLVFSISQKLWMLYAAQFIQLALYLVIAITKIVADRQTPAHCKIPSANPRRAGRACPSTVRGAIILL